MKSRRRKFTRRAILAAGGIVTRRGRQTLFAIVQRRKDKSWVLPKGKLKRRENAMAAARREVIEETGQAVRVGEFLGTISYESGGKPKVVQFWRMHSTGGETRELMPDIKAVKWLPLDHAIALLSAPLERAFLAQVGSRLSRTSHGRRRGARRRKVGARRVPLARRSGKTVRRPAVRSRRVAAARSKTTARKTQSLRAARSAHGPNLLRRVLSRLRQDPGTPP